MFRDKKAEKAGSESGFPDPNDLLPFFGNWRAGSESRSDVGVKDGHGDGECERSGACDVRAQGPPGGAAGGAVGAGVARAPCGDAGGGVRGPADRPDGEARPDRRGGG